MKKQINYIKEKKKVKSAKLTFKSRYSGHKIKITSKKQTEINYET